MARWGWGREFGDYFPPSTPLAAKGGIRAQSTRGGFGESWWAKRWITVLESFNIGGRLQRGRTYARKGQVLSIEFEKGCIGARVQGSRPTPYAVTIRVKPVDAVAWKKVAESVAGQAVYASKLLGGQMPQEMEEVFRAAGVSLFPERLRDLSTDCSCPDYSNPCKHIAAVYYLVGEEFDRDPFLIFRMRGMEREDFLKLLGERTPKQRPRTVSLPPEPLPAAPPQFWKVGPLPEDLTGDATASGGAAVTRRLGKFPFWRGRVGLQEFLEGAYGAASVKASEMLEGKTD